MREFTKEEKEYLANNFRTKLNRELAEELPGRNTLSINTYLHNHGLKRTPEERAALIARKKKLTKTVNRNKIEGGVDSNSKIKWHLEKWSKKKGKVPEDSMLFYRNGDYENFDDLVLIKKKDFDAFVRKRDLEKRDKNRKEEKEKGAAVLLALKKRQALKNSSREKKIDNFNKTYVQKSLSEAAAEEREKGKVPVRLDHKTIAWVKKDECIEKDGKWVMKNPPVEEPDERGYDWNSIKK